MRCHSITGDQAVHIHARHLLRLGQVEALEGASNEPNMMNISVFRDYCKTVLRACSFWCLQRIFASDAKP